MTVLPVVDPVAQPILDALLLCLENEIERVPVPPAVVCLRVGDRVDLLIAQGRDECCEGLAWIRLVQIYPSSDFPAVDETYLKCQLGWAVVVELGVVRCAPIGDENDLPTCNQWTELANSITADTAALRRTLMRFKALDDYRHTPYVPGTWEPMTTEGGCAGGAMLVTVQAPMCDVLED